ncbi:hypothetical protein DM01DRAFT_1381187 [Hesseltinella vesiculosa]|uniref:BZIP domain-containing protein n=1 Tax=Hesseltinella vesiculosa TaxID=101127 RepID=A0A1X2GRL2_9FUNG|nr:hypothetical protein DM01DRAFT_1381187 [Hesseltinella vesiculosa]
MSYISSLNILGEDPAIPLTEDDVTNELAVWANAQFKFDSTPGTALLDDSLKCETSSYLEYLSTTAGKVSSHHQDSSQTLLTGHAESLMHTETDMYMTNLLHSVVSSPALTSPSTPVSPTTPSFSSTPSAGGKMAHSNSMKKDSTVVQARAAVTPRDPNLSPEEDKRRRNTAASARFRQKKKQREQALHITVKEMTAKTEKLEARCKELELEAKWLRALLVEKNPALITPLSKFSSA